MSDRSAGWIADLERSLAAPDWNVAVWGVRIESLDGRVLFDHGGERNLIPASNMKLFTTAFALVQLGCDYRYQTPFIANGPIADGSLRGDLVIRGTGDPTLARWDADREAYELEVLDDWANRISRAGISRIEGDVVGDASCFTSEFYNIGWEWGVLPDSDAAGSSALAIAENAYRYRIAPGNAPGQPAHLSLQPQTSYIQPDCRIVTIPADGKITKFFLEPSDPCANRPCFRGEIPAANAAVINRGTIHDGAAYTATLVKETLERHGIPVCGAARSARNPAVAPDRRVLFTHHSPPLSEIIGFCNKPSNNFIAEQLLRTVAAQEMEDGSYHAGCELLHQWLGEIGIPDFEAFHSLDGSGLARRNVLQPQQTCALLRHMAASASNGPVYRQSLAVSGESKSMCKNFPDLPKGRVHAKTGWLEMVRTLAGYADTPSGDTVVFSFMANHFACSCQEVDSVIERTLMGICSE